MKIILSVSAIAMISAGLYGTADLVNDLGHGTMIEYDHDMPPPARTLSARYRPGQIDNFIRQKIAASEEKKHRQELKKAAPVINFNEFVSDFSRSMPVDYRYLDPLLTDSVTTANPYQPETNENGKTNNKEGIKKDSMGMEKNVPDSSNGIKSETKPEITIRSFSRGGFRKSKN